MKKCVEGIIPQGSAINLQKKKTKRTGLSRICSELRKNLQNVRASLGEC